MSELRQVLLVEDDPDISEILTLVLSQAQLAVEPVMCLADARAVLRARTGSFDAIVTDKNLPDGSGLTLLEEERSRGGDAELVVITGYPSLDSAVQAVRLGAYDYLEKPFRNLDDVVATVRRAADHRRLRRERDEARARAVMAERRATLVQVAAGLAHEVKNPLQGIGFACSNLRLALADVELSSAARADVLEQIGLIDAESRRLRELVEGVMDLARPMPRPQRRIPASQLLANVASLHATRAEHQAVKLRLQGDAQLAVRVDEADLTRALDNMLRNALDAAPAGSTIVLAADVTGEGIAELSVADEGVGIPTADRARLFTPFFTTKARGFGLGLCQVAAAADRAGGAVEIRDNIPTGARVVLRLPAATEGA